MSWHPDAERFNRELLACSGLGQACMYGALRQHPAHAAQQPWPVRYAYAIMDTFALTLDTFGERLPLWAEVYGYGVKHPWPRERTEATLAKVACDEVEEARIRKQYESAYEVLPAWTQQLLALSRPLRPQNVLDYWRVGKAMILEELPDFHERPEWAEYRTRRKYAGGAKPGVIQHAIFKDILAALRTIAGAGRRRPRIRKAK
jgi:hypothetical protein